MTDQGSRNGKKKMVKSSQDLILESSKDFDNHKIQFDKIGLQNHLVNNNDHQIIMQPMNIGGMDEFEQMRHQMLKQRELNFNNNKSKLEYDDFHIQSMPNNQVMNFTLARNQQYSVQRTAGGLVSKNLLHS